MKTKIVYVLTFNESNWYFEQALISACSARMHNPDAEIVIVTDNESEDLIKEEGWRRVLFKYVNAVLGVSVPNELNRMQRSRWLKTNLRSLVEGDYLFIDTDTVVCQSLEDIDNIEGDICAVRDLHCTALESRSGYMFQKFSQAKYPITKDFIYFNSGVMLVRDKERVHSFYQDWHRLWTDCLDKGVYIDQVALRMADEMHCNLICELPGQWNCQIEGRFLNYLSKARILHYFAYSKDHAAAFNYFKQLHVYEDIRAYHGLTPEIMQHLHAPYESFTSDYEVLTGNALACYYKFKPFFVLEGSPRRFSLFKKLANFLISRK